MGHQPASFTCSSPSFTCAGVPGTLVTPEPGYLATEAMHPRRSGCRDSGYGLCLFAAFLLSLSSGVGEPVFRQSACAEREVLGSWEGPWHVSQSVPFSDPGQSAEDNFWDFHFKN